MMGCIMQAARHAHLKPNDICVFVAAGLLPSAELPGLMQGSHTGALAELHVLQPELGCWWAYIPVQRKQICVPVAMYRSAALRSESNSRPSGRAAALVWSGTRCAELVWG